MRKALKKLENEISFDDLEKLSSLACHIEESEDASIFKDFAEFLNMYCTDSILIEKVGAVINEAADAASRCAGHTKD